MDELTAAAGAIFPGMICGCISGGMYVIEEGGEVLSVRTTLKVDLGRGETTGTGTGFAGLDDAV